MKVKQSVDYKVLGAHIRVQRKARGCTQEHLAEALVVSVGYISQCERGVTKISLDTLARVAAALSCDIGVLLTGVSQQREDYLRAELATIYDAMNDEKRRLLLDLAQCLLAH